MKKLLDFDLEIALKERERVVFADGTKVEDWHYFKGVNVGNPIVLFCGSALMRYTINGEFINGRIDNKLDLKLLPKTKTWWFCVYRVDGSEIHTSSLYETVEEMRNNIEGENLTILQEYTYTEELP